MILRESLLQKSKRLRFKFTYKLNEMLENIEQIIQTFQTRVDSLQNDWNVLSDAVTDDNSPSVSSQIFLLKSKLDLIQQQHTSIIVDLGMIKTHFLPQEEDLNNQFLTEENHESLSENKENRVPILDEDDEEEEENGTENGSISLRIPRIFKEEFKNEVLFSNSNKESISSMQQNAKYKVLKSLYQNKSKITSSSSSPKDISNFDNYQLVMSDCPKSVHDLYQEFYTDTKVQIMHFEEKYGVGQLSKLPKLRTYQRRNALVNAINKYAKGKGIGIDEAIDHFQGIVNENEKTIPWLYNNLAKILERYGIVQ